MWHGPKRVAQVLFANSWAYWSNIIFFYREYPISQRIKISVRMPTHTRRWVIWSFVQVWGSLLPILSILLCDARTVTAVVVYFHAQTLVLVSVNMILFQWVIGCIALGRCQLVKCAIQFVSPSASQVRTTARTIARMHTCETWLIQRCSPNRSQVCSMRKLPMRDGWPDIRCHPYGWHSGPCRRYNNIERWFRIARSRYTAL